MFGVTRDPFIVFTSNLFAILGDLSVIFHQHCTFDNLSVCVRLRINMECLTYLLHINIVHLTFESVK